MEGTENTEGGGEESLKFSVFSFQLDSIDTCAARRA